MILFKYWRVWLKTFGVMLSPELFVLLLCELEGKRYFPSTSPFGIIGHYQTAMRREASKFLILTLLSTVLYNRYLRKWLILLTRNAIRNLREIKIRMEAVVLMKFCNVFYFLFLWDWAVTDDPIPQSPFSILKRTTSGTKKKWWCYYEVMMH